ncbi:hypothetical protein O2W14_00070 [Modestobacter sp. VKM Ac-2986]|uniref:hypothetical protein n=1 Tax=Modestobacter sp. VKM Ac-2986 TaxID=3004140 RepID=UPI0022AA134B|nr:hypothetical protein [Modestobacter sp. VKM Ac-2986]MCZ2827226.1 hypothetical protein [Modestobacter sp. VKM Ac-2986]
MHFLDGSEGPDDEWERRHSAPENEAPVAVPVSAVLARSDTAAVTLTGVQVFTTGLTFTLGVRCRPEALGSGDISDLLWGHRGPGPQVLVGVELADGRRASNVPGSVHAFADPGDLDGLVFHHGSGSGGQLSAEQVWWLSPLPPAGPLRLVVRCDALGLPETVTELDGTALRAAAERVVTLWPWVSPRGVEPPQPPPGPELPADSWFART